MTDFYVTTEPAFQQVVGDMRSELRQHGRLRGRYDHTKRRSDDQNAISHAWYEQIARELREDDALGVKAYCKLHFGVPILRADDADFRAFYDAAIRSSLTYEQKLEAMSFVPVTSLMSTDQLSRYLEAVQHHYATRADRRVVLEFPEGM